MQTGTTVMDKPLWVPMDAEERKGHVDQLLRHLTRVDELEQALSAFQKKQRGLISAEMLEIHRLRRVLADDGQQMTLADAKIDDATPTPEQATAALAEVAKRVEWHKDGKLCASDTCKRRHVPEQALRNAGVESEQPATAETTTETAAPIETCIGCGAQLVGIERIKGTCEKCQTQKPGEDPLAGTPEAAPEQTDTVTITPESATRMIENIDTILGEQQRPIDPGAEDDPRPRCAACPAVLNADEVEKGLGLCQACIDATAPESDETPAIGGEAGA